MTEIVELENYPELESEVEESLNETDVRPVSSQSNDWNVATLRDKYDRGLIDLQPHYQREYVWELKPELPSRLIESLLLEIPIPPLYFMRVASGKIEVVDGQQRLTTFIRYVTNKFQLQKLQKMPSLNGKYFKDLATDEQEKILDSSMRSIVIDAGNNYDLRYEIFERLNRGAMSLNEQEIRNCAYRGLFCELLAELEQDANWRKVKGGEKPDPRFREREMILRFFALANRIDHYRGNLRKFLNDYMGRYAPNDAARVAELGAIFRQTMQNVYAAFGPHSGRLYTVEEGQPYESGKWETQFSISALDIQASAMIGHSPARVRGAAQAIAEAYKFYLVTNPHVRSAISSRPANKEATKIRWVGFKAVVQEIIGTVRSPGSMAEPLVGAHALFRAGYPTAAGAITGVALEGHLKKLCTKHEIPIIGKQSINAVNNLLKAKGAYDQTEARRIEVLTDIRNRCDHFVPNPPTEQEIRELIEGTEKIIRGYPVS